MRLSGGLLDAAARSRNWSTAPRSSSTPRTRRRWPRRSARSRRTRGPRTPANGRTRARSAVLVGARGGRAPEDLRARAAAAPPVGNTCRLTLPSKLPTEGAAPLARHAASYIAVVPAYNEAAHVGGVVRSIREQAPRLRRARGRRRLDRRHRASSPSDAGAHVLRHPFNLGIGGAVQSGFVYALENGYDYMVQIDGDGQHQPDELAKLLDAMDADPALDMVCGSRFLDRQRLPRADQPPHRDPHLRLPALAHRRPARERPDLGLPALQPARDRAVRPRLPARLPRGRGGADAPLPPAADARGARCGCTSAAAASRRSRSGKSVYYMVKVLLAIFVGLARARPVLEPGDEARWPRRTGSDGSRRSRSSRSSPRRAAARDRARAGPPAPAARALRAAVAAERDRAARASASGSGLLTTIAEAVGIAYPPNALFVIAFGFVLVLLLHFSVAVSRLSDQTKVLAQRLGAARGAQRATRRQEGPNLLANLEVDRLRPGA